MKNILFAVNHFDDTSVNNLVLQKALSLSNNQWTVFIFSLTIDGELKAEFEQHKNLRLIARDSNWLKTIYLIGDFVFRNKIKYISTQALRAEYLFFLIKLFCYIRYDFTFTHVSERHLGFFKPFTLKNFIKNIAYIVSVNLSNFNLCVSKHIFFLNKQLSLYNKDKVFLIRNGIQLRDINDKNKMREKLNLPLNRIILIYTGRLAKVKNISFLLKSLSLIKTPYLFLILGSGPEENQLKMLVSEREINNKVIFLGFIKNVNDYLEASDIFVLPSFTEGLSLSLIEAMNSKLACIVSNCRGNLELISDKRNGLVFDLKNDYKHLSEKLDLLIKDKSLREQYGLISRKIVKNSFGINSMLTKTNSFYNTIGSCNL